MEARTGLFSPLKIRDTDFRNRIFVSPMCQYSADEGIPNDWHLVHLGSRAVGGAGLVMTEATSVAPEGRISPADTGLWTNHQGEAFKKITSFLKQHGAVPAIQLAHAGRKASTAEPWNGGKPLGIAEGGWPVLAPSNIPFASGYPTPKVMTEENIISIAKQFEDSTKRAIAAGFEVVEIHMAHGYLLHEFLSPLSNQRADQFGGSLDNRMRFPLMVARMVRDAWPKNLPVFVRVSATDWSSGGWDLDQTIAFSRELKNIGVDFIDVSTGGLVSDAKIPVEVGFQVPFAREIKKSVGIMTGAVGMITNAKQAERILQDDAADAILIAREFLRDPYFPLHAARELGVAVSWPKQYERAR
jgi:2,4-dienoyl-CoA reductase-like NADH-dependent reductase (Old Yellow Enzyme family)